MAASTTASLAGATAGATPAGGIAFIAGWLALTIGALTRERAADGG
jgi:uncharacterized membrane protein YgdD (TMEM256/DUF423 family)